MMQHTCISALPGQRPGVLFPPSPLHELVDMHVPLVLPTLQVSGVVDSSFVQHYSNISDPWVLVMRSGLPEHHWDLSDNSLA